eukprot:gene3316-4155_t
MKSFLNRNYKYILLGTAIVGPYSLIVGYNSLHKYERLDTSKESINSKILTENQPPSTFKEYKLPSRADLLERLDKIYSLKKQTGTDDKKTIKLPSELRKEELDLIVIGGGATGAGVALDAQTRGLKVALFERDDFSSGTSSRSTKLIHGGIRYLESAVMNLDYDELSLVKEALNERSNLIYCAPHLSRPLPILIPVYSWIDLPKFWFGTKLYDFFYPYNDFPSSRYMSAKETLGNFPYLKNGLLGSIVYYDGQHNDSRMNVAITLTAASKGALTLNYMEVVDFMKEEPKNPSSPIKGVVVKDRLTGKQYHVPAKCVVNATGPFSDNVRKLDNPTASTTIAASSGVHIVLPQNLCPPGLGFLNPKTKDGRLLFLLPFEGKTIAGTTDEPTQISYQPKPTEKEIDFIIDALSEYTDPNSKPITKDDVLSAWSGIRPLVKKGDLGTGPTSKINRSHTIRESPSGLISISGGKWTTYRSMAKDVVDNVIRKTMIFTPNECITENLILYGGDQYFKNLNQYLIKNYNLSEDVALHLSHNYGDQAIQVAQIASSNKELGNKLVEGYPFLEAEVLYAVRKEYACTAQDVIARRTRLAFLDNKKSIEALPKIINIMAKELNWNNDKKKSETQETLSFLNTMK